MKPDQKFSLLKAKLRWSVQRCQGNLDFPPYIYRWPARCRARRDTNLTM
jgi:hypothetical protein